MTITFNPCPKPPVHAKDAKFLKWVRATQHCLVCGLGYRSGFNAIETAHLESRRYGDVENVVPLCGSVHHREGPRSLHVMGREKFSAFWRVDLKAAARALYHAYLAQNAPQP